MTHLYSLTAIQTAKVIEVPVNAIERPDQLKELIGARGEEGEEAPNGFDWDFYSGPINMSTNILFPLEGTTLRAQFEVMIEVKADPLGAFESRYKDAYHCIELDGAIPACWPLFDVPVHPRFAAVSEGEHSLRAAITDMHGEWIDEATWSPVRRVTVSETIDDEAAEDGGEVVAEPDADDPPETFKLDIPISEIVRPYEMAVLTTSFFDLQYVSCCAVFRPPTISHNFHRRPTN